MKKRAFVFILLATLVLSFAACGGNESSNNKSSVGDAVQNDSTGKEEPPAKDSSDSQEPTSKDKSVGFGGTISGECFDISIVDAKWTDSLDISMGSVSIQNTPQKDENKLLCLIFNAKNTTDDTENLGMFNAYVDKQAVLPTSVLGKVDDAMIFVGAVASGMEMKAYQVWELPENWEEFQLNYFEATGPECSQCFIIHREDIDKT